MAEPIKYGIKFTELARAFAKAHTSLQAVAEAALAEIDDMGLVGDDRLNGQISFKLGEQLFVGVGFGDGVVVVDTASWEEGPVLDSGPFKGKKVMIPRGDSEDRG